MNIGLTRIRSVVRTAVAALLTGGAGVACATTSDDGEREATGARADRARAGALPRIDGGRANSVG